MNQKVSQPVRNQTTYQLASPSACKHHHFAARFVSQAQREGLQRRIEVSEQHCAEHYAKTEQLRQQLALAEGEIARLEIASDGLQAADSTKADRIDR